MNEPLVYIILVNYINYKVTIECVNSLKEIQYSNKKILIVDNDSKNESYAELTKACSDCLIIQSTSNHGWAGGNNIGIEYALKNNAEYVLLLNNDTEVKIDFLTEMVKVFASDHKTGAVGSKIMYYEEQNKIWYAGGKINWFKFTGEHFRINEYDNEQTDQLKEVDFITGCNILIKREVIETIGLIPEEYFMYFEDCDYCTRIIESGYKMYYNPNAVSYHKVSSSSGGEDSAFTLKWMTRNKWKFMGKYHKKSPFYPLSYIFRFLSVIYLMIKNLLNKDLVKAKAVMNGFIEGLKT